jgi:DNA polymerase-1
VKDAAPLLFGGVRLVNCPDLENVRRLDLLPIPMIRRAHRVGMAIDPPYFAELSSRFAAEMVTLEKDIASYIPPDRLTEFADSSEAAEEEGGAADFNAGSAEQIGKLLFDMLKIGRDETGEFRRDLKTTKGGQRLSTGKKQLELIRSHPIVPLILRFREIRTLKRNYCDKIPRMARFHPRGECCSVCELPHDTDQWRVHGEMGTTRAETGRINHKNPNMGNNPSRSDDGQAVQAGFIAPPGFRLVASDLSQIELRDLAHLANCKSMIETYEQDGDLHTETCYKTGLTPPGRKPTVAERMGAKRCGFGIQNGTTEKGLFLQLVMDFGNKKEPVPDWLTEDWCKWFIEQWLLVRPEVQALFDRCHYRARRYGMSWEPLGRVRLVPEVKSYLRWVREAGMRQAQNMPVTSFAAGQLKLAMGKADMLLEQMRERGVRAWPLLTIHDSIMVEAEEKYAEDALETLSVAMNTCMDSEDTGECLTRVKIKSDGEVMFDKETGVSRWKKG